MARIARGVLAQWMTRWARVATPTLSAIIAVPLLVLSTTIAALATHRIALAFVVPLLAATIGVWLCGRACRAPTGHAGASLIDDEQV